MNIRTLFLGAVIGAGALTALAAPASAYVVCDRSGDDCWHSESRYRAPGIRFDYHPDDWYFHRRWEGDRYHWRSDYHRDRGYWHNGLWITF